MWKYYRNDELCHYGVLGMRWGIRRNARVLANHRRNVNVRNIKDQYAIGKITKTQRDSKIKQENAKKKLFISDIRNKSNSSKDLSKLRKMQQDLAKQDIKEVPSNRLKKGLSTANNILGGIHIAKSIGTGVMAAPLLGPAAIIPAGVSAGMEYGLHKAAQLGIDRLS